MSTTGRLFELRTYTAAEGKLDYLISRFEHYTLRLFESHGMKVEGFWLPIENQDNNLIYLLSYPSAEAREKSWLAFQNDPEWLEARDNSNRDGDILLSKESIYLEAANFSPLK